MADIKAIREKCGGTVNDVVLTVITSTVRRYAKQHGVNLSGRHLRMIVPVNIRGNGDVAELGNRITFLPIMFRCLSATREHCWPASANASRSSEASAYPKWWECLGCWYRKCRLQCRRRWFRC